VLNPKIIHGVWAFQAKNGRETPLFGPRTLGFKVRSADGGVGGLSKDVVNIVGAVKLEAD
jgi:hypothetical protein